MKLIIFTILLISAIGIDALNKQTDCKCRINSLGRIVGGKDAARQSYPWHVRIVYGYNSNMKDSERFNLCSATILNENTLLTSGSCFLKSGYNVEGFRAVIKDTNEYFKIEKIIMHPRYSIIHHNLIKNDIAIVKLNKSLTLTNLVQPGCLNVEHKKSYEGVTLKAAGYGFKKVVSGHYNYWDHMDPNDLVNQTFTETELIDQTYYLCPNDNDEVLCVASRFNQNLCVSDEGTALLETVNGRSNVVGVAGVPMINIINQTVELCRLGSRGVKVSAYRSFIESHVGDNYCHN